MYDEKLTTASKVLKPSGKVQFTPTTDEVTIFESCVRCDFKLERTGLQLTTGTGLCRCSLGTNDVYLECEKITKWELRMWQARNR